MTGKTARGEGKGVRFLRAHVEHGEKACLTWPFARSRGYGQFGYMGELLYAHRFMCELAHGPAPADKPQCRHLCGNGHLGCVNPKHLRWATQSENHFDRRRHGTANTAKYGHAGRVLTPSQIISARRLYRNQKLTVTALARWYSVSRRTIERAVKQSTTHAATAPLNAETE